MSESFRHVIFDLDGTLLDTEPLYTIAAERVCAGYGASFTLELKRLIMGGDTESGAELVVRTLSLPIGASAYIEERERVLEQLFPSLEPKPHAPALVDELTKRGVAMAIATSGHRRITREKLAYQSFLDPITTQVCGDDPRLARGKPAPDIFLLAARELQVAPECCVAVEDSVLGVQAAVAAGMRTVALVDARYGFRAEQFRGAARVVSSLEELDLDALGLPARAR
jgi:pseudouridine-5'-monophosphatase